MHNSDKESPAGAQPPGGAVAAAPAAARAVVFRAEQIRAQYGNMPGAFIGTAVIASVVAEILYERRLPSTVLSWLAVAYLHSGARCALWLAFRRAKPSIEDTARWGKWLVAGAFTSGLIWGVGGIVLYSPASLSYELFVLLVTTGLVFTSTYVSAPYMPAFVAFALPTFLLSCVPFLLTGGALHLAIGAAALLLFLPLITSYALMQCRAFVQSLDFRLRNAELVAELRAQKLAAEAANVAKSRFLAVASHDLRQPLHALGLFVEALQQSRLPTHERQLVGNVRRTLDAMEELFDELLDISRLDAGVVRARMEAFELAPVLDRLGLQYASMAHRKGLSLSVLSTKACARSDPRLLGRIVGNLLANAVRYTQRGGVVLGCRREGNGLRIEVWDTGRGIPPDKHGEVFKEFAQLANPERESSQGLGLGLAIVARLASLLDHRIHLRSAVGKGSVFGISVPRSRLEECLAQESAARSATFDLSGTLALVIDDDPEGLGAVSTLLENWNCKVVAASSGTQMLARSGVLSSVPNLIVSDYRLSGGECGVAVVKMLRNEFNFDIPALLLTADPDSAAEQSGLPVLRKPLRPAQLRTLIVNLLRAAA